MEHILDQLTKQNFSGMMLQAFELDLDTEDRLERAADLVFECAISDERKTELCAQFSFEMTTLPKVPNPQGGADISFRAKLLTRCQKEFEELMEKPRHRVLGNIRFLGELFRLKMLTETIMHNCIIKLIKMRDDDSIEALTRLLNAVGANLDVPKDKSRMDQYFQQLEKILVAKNQRNDRVKAAVLEIIELRKNNWVRPSVRPEADQEPGTCIG